MMPGATAMQGFVVKLFGTFVLLFWLPVAGHYWFISEVDSRHGTVFETVDI
jgi:hypothetical protein